MVITVNRITTESSEPKGTATYLGSIAATTITERIVKGERVIEKIERYDRATDQTTTTTFL